MTIGIVGKKRGMTRVFTEAGESIPVTVIEATPNRVTQVLTVERHGYRAVQVAWGQRKPQRLRKPQAGQFNKLGLEAAEGLVEYRLLEDGESAPETGSALGVDLFTVGQKVDVTGTTKGKGFAGVIKRHNFSSQRMSHGNSRAHRAPGSIGQCQFPGKVFKGKKMPGHMGDKRRTAQNLEVVRVDVERNLLLVKGSVPAGKGTRVLIRSALKQAAGGA